MARRPAMSQVAYNQNAVQMTVMTMVPRPAFGG